MTTSNQIRAIGKAIKYFCIVVAVIATILAFSLIRKLGGISCTILTAWILVPLSMILEIFLKAQAEILESYHDISANTKKINKTISGLPKELVPDDLQEQIELLRAEKSQLIAEKNSLTQRIATQTAEIASLRTSLEDKNKEIKGQYDVINYLKVAQNHTSTASASKAPWLNADNSPINPADIPRLVEVFKYALDQNVLPAIGDNITFAKKTQTIYHFEQFLKDDALMQHNITLDQRAQWFCDITADAFVRKGFTVGKQLKKCIKYAIDMIVS